MNEISPSQFEQLTLHNNSDAVLIVTEPGMPGDRERAIESGFDDYLTKPITPETFVAQIESLIGHHTTPQDP